MKHDIENRTDIENLVTAFYQKAVKDKIIGHFFTKVIPLDLDEHLPRIIDFWESILLDKVIYKGNPMLKHIALNQKVTLTKAHFEQWLELWKVTIEEHFEGEKAVEAKEKARNLANLMRHKIEQSLW